MKAQLALLIALGSSITSAIPLSSHQHLRRCTATPPGVPSESSASSMLAGLSVADAGSLVGYSRDEFPHWITQSGSCNTREVVLKRDGTGVVIASDCSATSGSWLSPYDDATWTASGDVDIDHMVPLANAWVVCCAPYIFLVSSS